MTTHGVVSVPSDPSTPRRSVPAWDADALADYTAGVTRAVVDNRLRREREAGATDSARARRRAAGGAA